MPESAQRSTDSVGRARRWLRASHWEGNRQLLQRHAGAQVLIAEIAREARVTPEDMEGAVRLMTGEWLSRMQLAEHTGLRAR